MTVSGEDTWVRTGNIIMSAIRRIHHVDCLSLRAVYILTAMLTNDNVFYGRNKLTNINCLKQIGDSLLVLGA